MKSGTLWVRHKITLGICVLGKYLAVDHKGWVEGRPGSLEVNYAKSGGSLPSTMESFHPCRKLEGIRICFHQQGIFCPCAFVGHRTD